MQTRSLSLAWPVLCHSSFSGVPPGSLWYTLLSLQPSRPFPYFNLPLMPMRQLRSAQPPPNITSCYYTNLLMFGLLIAFHPCFFVYSPSNDPTLRNEFMPISSSIPTLPKSCTAAFLSASFVFVTPKASSLPYGLWLVYPCSSGGLVVFVRFFIVVELGAAVVVYLF